MQGSYQTEDFQSFSDSQQIRQEVVERLESIADLVAQVSNEISKEIANIADDLLDS